MKKLKRLSAAFAAVALAFSFAACSWEEGGAPAGVDNPFTQGRPDSGDGGSGSGNGSGNAVLSTVSTVTQVEKGAEYSGDITLDLSGTPLNDAGVANFAEGSDFSDYVTANVRTASGANTSILASRSVRAAYDDGDSSNGVAFSRIEIVSIAKDKIVFKITTTTPTEDSVVLLNVSIPAQYSESGSSIEASAGVLKVGDGVSISDAKAEFTVPTDAELKGKVFKVRYGASYFKTPYLYYDVDNKLFYNTFEKLQGEVTYSKGTITVTFTESDTDTLDDDDVKELSKNPSIEVSAGQSVSSTFKMVYTFAIRKHDGEYYIGMPFERTSGSGLFATFMSPQSFTTDSDIGSFNYHADIDTNTYATLTAEGIMQLTVKSTLKDITSSNKAYLDELKAALKEEYKEIPVCAAAVFYDANEGLITGYGAEASSSGGSNAGTLADDWWYDGDIIFRANKAELYTGEWPATDDDDDE